LLDPARATTDREFEAMWGQYVREAPDEKVLTIRETGRTKAPHRGTSTERSSVANQRKITALMETPPPPPPRRRIPVRKPPATKLEKELQQLFGDIADLDDEETVPAAETPAAPAVETPAAPPAEAPTAPPVVFGPVGPPPVKVRIDGHDTFVPYFAATISRRYRVNAGNQRYVLRFNRTGQCVYARKIIK